MSARLNSIRTLLAVAIVLAILQATATAAINIANLKPVIGGSGDYPGVPFNFGNPSSYPYQSYNVTDGQNAADPNNNSGGITEPNQDGSYWLGNSNTGY